MRLLSPLFLILCLAACQRSGQNNDEAVRQGILDHFAASSNKITADVKIVAVKYNGDQADAEVQVVPPGSAAAGIPPMSLKYHLERQDNKWKVVGRAAEGHGTAADPNAPPATANPHGGEMPGATPPGAMPPAGGSGKMPSPSDLPPTKKK